MMPPDPNDRRLTRTDLWVMLGFLAFLLAFFSGVLAQPGEYCLGRADGDARNQFYGWRAYGFGQISQGRFPLWNPYEFLGVPFVASLQSAMFYPMNWFCAVMPLGRGINFSIISGLFLSCLFTYLWCRRLGMRWTGAIVAGSAYTFGAPQLLRVFEGHWSFLACMPWTPCILWCLEAIATGAPKLPWVAVGAVALGLQLCGGNPQYAFHGGIAAMLYLGARLAMERRLGAQHAVRSIMAFAGIYLLGTLLSGVQMAPALELLSISSRKGNLTLEWVSKFSWVAEGISTLVVPDFLGDDMDNKFWARWNLWEMSAYVGIIALALAVLAIWRARRAWALIGALAAVLFGGLALSGETAVLNFLFKYVPGFNLFRSQARFLCPMSLFLGLLAGLGADALIASAREDAARLKPREIIGVAVAALALAAAGWAMYADFPPMTAAFSDMMHWVWRQSLSPEHYIRNLPTISRIEGPAMHAAAWGTWRAAALLGVLAGVMLMARHRRGWAMAATAVPLFALALVLGLTAHRLTAAVVAAATVAGAALFLARPRLRMLVIVGVLLSAIGTDLWSYGRRYMVTFTPNADGLTPGALAYLRAQPGPFRWARGGCFTLAPCEGMTHELACIEGVQPNAPLLFRDVFWTFQQRPNMDRDLRRMQFTSYSVRNLAPQFRMLNLAYLVAYRGSVRTRMEGLRTVYEDERIRIDALPGPLGRAWLVHEALVIEDDEELLKAVADERFNYELGALLSRGPAPALQFVIRKDPPPTFTRYEPHRVTIEAEPIAAALLVVSDLYYPGWKATLDGEPVEILRANYCMRGVVVPAGKHTVEFVYDPASFKIGLAASAAGVIGVGVILFLHRRLRSKGPT